MKEFCFLPPEGCVDASSHARGLNPGQHQLPANRGDQNRISYRFMDAITTEQVAQGYAEEKMEVGATSSSLMGVSQGAKGGVGLDTMVQRLVQKNVRDIDSKCKRRSRGQSPGREVKLPSRGTSSATSSGRRFPLCGYSSLRRRRSIRKCAI